MANINLADENTRWNTNLGWRMKRGSSPILFRQSDSKSIYVFIIRYNLTLYFVFINPYVFILSFVMAYGSFNYICMHNTIKNLKDSNCIQRYIRIILKTLNQNQSPNNNPKLFIYTRKTFVNKK